MSPIYLKALSTNQIESECHRKKNNLPLQKVYSRTSTLRSIGDKVETYKNEGDNLLKKLFV